MILRLILIAILIYLFIRISQRLLTGVRNVTGGGYQNNYRVNPENEKRRSEKKIRFDDIEEAEFEELNDNDEHKRS